MFQMSPNIALHVSDRDSAAEFYKSVLGFDLIKAHNTADNGVEMKAGDTTFWIDQSPTPEKTGEVFFEFFVNDLKTERDLLIQKGCTSLFVTTCESHVGEMFADPFGLKFHLYQKPLAQTQKENSL